MASWMEKICEGCTPGEKFPESLCRRANDSANASTFKFTSVATKPRDSVQNPSMSDMVIYRQLVEIAAYSWNEQG